MHRSVQIVKFIKTWKFGDYFVDELKEMNNDSCANFVEMFVRVSRNQVSML
jgi:hypothetical protein